MKNEFELRNEALMANHLDEVKNYKLFYNGTALFPVRFAKYLLINITRPYDEKRILQQGFVEHNIDAAIEIHNGISFTLLSN